MGQHLTAVERLGLLALGATISSLLAGHDPMGHAAPLAGWSWLSCR